jgi:hypothetical protein
MRGSMRRAKERSLVVISTLGSPTRDSTAREDGAALGHGLYSVSDYGEMMTATMRGVNA